MSSREFSTYGRVGWALRLVIQNVGWLRSEGLAKMVEEHELTPVGNTRTAVRKALWRRRHGVAPGSARAVVLGGMGRSGTNMMVRGLAQLPQMQTYNDGDHEAFARYRLRPDPDVQALVRASRHELVLIKPILDSDRMPRLLDLLGPPGSARGLWAFREAHARAASEMSKHGASGTNALTELARIGTASTRWEVGGLSAETLDLIRGVDWSRATPQDGAVMLWVVRNRLFFELGLDRRPDVMALSYDAVVADPEPVMRAVCRHLGTPWDPRVSAEMDRRTQRRVTRLDVDPGIQALVDDLAVRMDAAFAADLDRYSGSDVS